MVRCLRQDGEDRRAYDFSRLRMTPGAAQYPCKVQTAGVVRRLVYCDAYVPEDDQSWDLTTDAYRSLFLESAAADGYAVQPPSGRDPRVTAHPLASFLQRIRLDTGGLREVKTRDYVYLSGWDGTPFTTVRDRLANDPTWRVHTLDSGHDVWRDAPQEFLETLLLGE